MRERLENEYYTTLLLGMAEPPQQHRYQQPDRQQQPPQQYPLHQHQPQPQDSACRGKLRTRRRDGALLSIELSVEHYGEHYAGEHYAAGTRLDQSGHHHLPSPCSPPLSGLPPPWAASFPVPAPARSLW